MPTFSVPSMLIPPVAEVSVRVSTVLVFVRLVLESSTSVTLPVDDRVSEAKFSASPAAVPRFMLGAVRLALAVVVTLAETVLEIWPADSSVSCPAVLLQVSSVPSSSAISTVPVVWNVTDPMVTKPAAATVMLPLP